MGVCDTCKNSKFNNGGMWCKYSPRYSDINDVTCRNDDHYESIYTIEPTIVLGTRFYTPQTNDGMKETEPIVLAIPEEE